VFSAGQSLAAPRDAAANQKIDEAINTHYLATEFDKAEALLKGVLDACEDRCSPSVKGKAWMYVGVVRGSGRQNMAGAQEAFKQALALDPQVKLDDALATPAVRQAFAAAGGAPGEAAATPKTTGAKVAAAESAGAVPGAMECTPTVKEVEQQRPIPVACTTDEPATKVVLRYFGFGADDWKQVQLTKKGEYWQGEIPCAETGNVGQLRYYVQAKDKDGGDLDNHGTKTEPAEISIVSTTSEEPPSYPGQPAPAKCMEASGCPDDMIGTPACPGTAKARGNKAWGSPCDTSQECDSGLLCTQGDTGRTCETAPSCDGKTECPEGSVCKSGQCDVGDEGGGAAAAGPAGPYKKNLVGLHFGVDFGFLSGKDVCARGSDFNCFDGAGHPYINPTLPGGGGNLNGGAAPGTVRILASYERLFSSHFGLEGRLGFAFNGGPKAANGTAFLPIHVEARGKYWFMKDGFSKRGIRPYVFLGGGIAQVDTHLLVTVYETNGTRHKVDAYRKLGQSFLALGGGAMYAFKPRHGLLLNLNFMYMLGSTGPVIEPSLGYEYGF
jgi:hypothetical protein